MATNTPKPRAESLADELIEIARQCANLPVLDARSDDEILGYDKQVALTSWAAYKKTGRHLTGQEVRARLNTWGTDDEGPAPECHE